MTLVEFIEYTEIMHPNEVSGIVATPTTITILEQFYFLIFFLFFMSWIHAQ